MAKLATSLLKSSVSAASFLACVTAGLAVTPAPSFAASADERMVYLMQQDQSDCTNADVKDSDDSKQKGTAWVTRGSDGITRVKVGITIEPGTTYHFFLKCVRLLGDIKTQDEGEASASFEFPTNAVGDVYAFDMYPEGAPAGSKFQSIQVSFK